MTRSIVAAIVMSLSTVSAASAQLPDGMAAPRTAPAPQVGDAAATPPVASTANQYAAGIQTALGLVASRDYDGALAQLRQAASFSSEEPLAYYLMGELHRLRASTAEALEMFRTASRLADTGTDFQMQARARLAIAQSLEQMDGHLDEARTAWSEYVRFSEAHPTAGTAEWGRTRLQSIDIAHEQEDVYVGVRQRIAARALTLTQANAASRAPAPRR